MVLGLTGRAGAGDSPDLGPAAQTRDAALPSACSLLPVATVADAFGGPVSAKKSDYPPIDSFCLYRSTKAAPARYSFEVLITDLTELPPEADTIDDYVKGNRRTCKRVDGQALPGVGAAACVYVNEQRPKAGVQFGAVTAPAAGEHRFDVGAVLQQLDSKGKKTEVTFLSEAEALAKVQSLGVSLVEQLSG